MNIHGPTTTPIVCDHDYIHISNRYSWAQLPHSVYAWSPWLYWCSPKIYVYIYIYTNNMVTGWLRPYALLKLHQLMYRPLTYASVISWRWYTLCSSTHVPFLLNSLLITPSPSICFWYLEDYSESTSDPSSFESCTIISLLVSLVFRLVSVSQLLPPCQLVWIVFRSIHHVSVYIDKFRIKLQLPVGILLYPKHDHFGCFSRFSPASSDELDDQTSCYSSVCDFIGPSYYHLSLCYNIFSSKTTCTIHEMNPTKQNPGQQ